MKRLKVVEHPLAVQPPSTSRIRRSPRLNKIESEVKKIVEHMRRRLAKGPIAYFQLFVEPELLQKYMTQHLGLPAPLLGSARHCIFWYVKTDWENTRDQLPTNLCPCRHLAAASQRPEFRRDDQIYSLGSGSVYKHNHHKNSRTHRQYHYGEDNPKNRYPGKDIDATYVLLSRTGVWLTSFYACKAAAVKKFAERIVNDQCGTL